MKKLIIVWVGVMLVVSFSLLGEGKIITAAADPWPPFVDPQNPTEGLSLEIVRAAFKVQGYEVKMDYVPWARAEAGVKEGTYDILPNTWKTEKRLEYLVYSEPYAYNKIKFIKRKDDSFEFTGLESLSGKIIGTVRGYGYGDEFLNASNFQREEVNEMLLNAKKLVAGRVDLTLEDEIVFRVRVSQEDPGLMEKISFTKNSLSSNALHITSGKSNPRHKEIIDAFNKGLKKIKKNGIYDKILEKYGIK